VVISQLNYSIPEVISQLNYSIPNFWFLFSQPDWFGTLLLFFHSVGNGKIIPSDEDIFFRGEGLNHQPVIVIPVIPLLSHYYPYQTI